MTDHQVSKTQDGFTMKLWRGERMCLVAFDVEQPPDDFVGFAIEFKPPGSSRFMPLKNRIAFEYQNAELEVTGAKKFDSTLSPFQKYRWVHFPFEVPPGVYRYRGTMMHMPSDGKPVKGKSIELKLSLDPVTRDGFVDIGFTRGFASSQAFRDRAPSGVDVDEYGASLIPSERELEFEKPDDASYAWMGFEAHDLIFALLKEAVDDASVTLDVMAYDLNEGDLVAHLESLGARLRIVIDDSTQKKKGVVTGHGTRGSDESKAATRLRKSAGASHVKRTHFYNLQHHKVLIARRNGVPYKVLCGSTNFSYRGFYIQSNNVLVFQDPGVAGLFGEVFDIVFSDPASFRKSDLSKKWHLFQGADGTRVHLCFSPHTATDVALNPVRGAIEQATSSVLYNVAFLNLIKSGPTKEAFDRVITRSIFSYGVSDEASGMQVRKPNGSRGLVDFAYLAQKAPEPFKSEWSGGGGINVHHKFVITDFNLPTGKVFTGSSNLSPSGENNNGDHLIMIEDPRIAVAYAIEALRVFDHLHFRNNMEDVFGKKGGKKKPKKPVSSIKLRKPTAISGEPAWFEEFYEDGSSAMLDRLMFSR